MKCPHCHKESKGRVISSRRLDADVWRIRLCGICTKQFVSRETTSTELKFPWDEIQKRRRRAVAPEEKPVQKENRWVFPDKLW